MAQIELREVSHSYLPKAQDESEYALKRGPYGVGGRRRVRAFGAVRLRENHAPQYHLRLAYAV